jgi:hypothetical protein
VGGREVRRRPVAARRGPSLPRPPFRSFLATAADPSPNFGGGVFGRRRPGADAGYERWRGRFLGRRQNDAPVPVMCGASLGMTVSDAVAVLQLEPSSCRASARDGAYRSPSGGLCSLRIWIGKRRARVGATEVAATTAESLANCARLQQPGQHRPPLSGGPPPRVAPTRAGPVREGGLREFPAANSFAPARARRLPVRVRNAHHSLGMGRGIGHSASARAWAAGSTGGETGKLRAAAGPWRIQAPRGRRGAELRWNINSCTRIASPAEGRSEWGVAAPLPVDGVSRRPVRARSIAKHRAAKSLRCNIVREPLLEARFLSDPQVPAVMYLLPFSSNSIPS